MSKGLQAESDCWMRIYELVHEHNVQFHGEDADYDMGPLPDWTDAQVYRRDLYGAIAALVDAWHPGMRALCRERDDARQLAARLDGYGFTAEDVEAARFAGLSQLADKLAWRVVTSKPHLAKAADA